MGLFSIFNKSPSFNHNPYSDKYYEHMEQIDAMWSVLQNLHFFTGDQADSLESLCRENIKEYIDMSQFDISHKIEPPHHAPCYVRLAMLYEKQNRYEDGINLCVAAIKMGAYEDSSKGKMYGRLARLIRKSGIQVSDEILKLSQVR